MFLGVILLDFKGLNTIYIKANILLNKRHMGLEQ